MKKIFVFFLGCFCTLLLKAQTEVTPYQPGITENGITYFLPRTAFHIVLTMTRTSYKPGRLAAYAEVYLRQNNVVREAYDEWTIQNIRIEPYGTPDKSQAYTIKLKPRTSAPLVSLTRDGILLGINTSVRLPGELTQSSITKLIADSAENFGTQEMLAAGNIDKLAQLAAEEIFNIRDSRLALAKGEADFMPQDGEQLKLMMASLDKQEAGLLKLFLGTHTSETCVSTVNCILNTPIENSVLCRFSSQKGLLNQDEADGQPIYISMTSRENIPQAVETIQKKQEEDVRYVVPAVVQVKIFDDKQIYTNLETPVAQLGRIEHLGGDLFNKKMNTHITFSPETGGILRIEAEGQNQ